MCTTVEGRSALARERNEGLPDKPLGEANTRFCACEAKAPVSVPEDVTGELETVKIEGSDRPTLFTVPLLLNVFQSLAVKRPLEVADADGRLSVIVPPERTGEPLMVKSVPLDPVTIFIPAVAGASGDQ